MNLYLDDDIEHGVLVKLLVKAGHDVQLPFDAIFRIIIDGVDIDDYIGMLDGIV